MFAVTKATFSNIASADLTVCLRHLYSIVSYRRASDMAKLLKNSLSRNEHRTDINTKFRSVSIITVL